MVLPVVKPLTVPHPEGVVEAAMVTLLSMSVPILPLIVYVCTPVGKVIVSVKAIVPSLPLASVAEPSLGPATTAPVSSTIIALVMSSTSSFAPSPTNDTLNVMLATEIASPFTSTASAPKGWFARLIPMFCAATDVATETFIVPVETVTCEAS